MKPWIAWGVVVFLELGSARILSAAGPVAPAPLPATPAACAGLPAGISGRIRSRIAKIRECHRKSQDPANVTSAVQSLIDQSPPPKPTRRGAICIDCCGGPIRGAAVGAPEEVRNAAYLKAIDYMLCKKDLPDQGIFAPFGANADKARSCADAWLRVDGPSCLSVLMSGADFPPTTAPQQAPVSQGLSAGDAE